MKKNVLITGANGFVGHFLGNYLSRYQYQIVHALRRPESKPSSLAPGRYEFLGNIDADTNWTHALQNIDYVVHLAARVHVMQEAASNPLEAFQATNLHATVKLAQQAVKAGVKRLIYLSTIKVNGEATDGSAFQADADPVNLTEAYAISKFQAEQALLEIHQKGLLEIVIIRPPLVYGPAVKGNFLRLMKLMEKQWPLPLAKINNQRSLVNLHNLSSLIQVCLEHPQAAGEVFLVSDGEDLSSSELLTRLADALGSQQRLFYLPKSILKALTSLLGKAKEFDRLFNSLSVDIQKNQELLNWQPQFSIDKALTETADYYGQYQK